MTPRQSRLPQVWLMTDERIPDLIRVVERLPRNSGIVFRHHATPAPQRRALFEQVRGVAKRRRLTLFLSGPPIRARQWKADGAHHRSRLASQGLRSVAVHNGAELALAQHIRADLIFVSPVFVTRSHPGRHAMGVVMAGILAGRWRRRAIALGGMTRQRARRLHALGFYGWAAIDGLSLLPR